MNNNLRTSAPTKTLFSRLTSVTLSVSLMIIALSVLGRAICAMIFSQRLSVLNSIYQIFGSGSVPVVDLVFGIITALIIALLSIGVFSARSGVNSEPAMASGLRFLKAGIIISLIYTAFAVVISFASVSVINYNDISGYTGNINLSATGLFWFTLFIGLALLCCEIAFIRFSDSMIRNIEDGVIAKRGTALIFLASIIGTITSIIAFCIKLYQLVAPPKDYIKNINADKAVKSLENSELILNSFNVIIFASLIVVFITLAMLAGSYAISADMIIRNARMGAYNAGHTVINPENIPDYRTDNNYNYNQSANYVPYYKANQVYQDIYKNIYTGEVPPVPKAPENPFKSKTQYPTQPSASPQTQNTADTDIDSTVPVNLDKN